jgi:hypothetical protein
MVLCEVVDNSDPHDGVCKLSIFDFGLVKGKFFDLLMFFEDLASLDGRLAIRELNNKVNTIKERK